MSRVAAIVAPGAEVVGPLAVIDPPRLMVRRIDLLVAFERQIAWLHAAQQRVLADWMVGVELEREAEDRLHQEQVGQRYGSHPPRGRSPRSGPHAR